MGNSIPLDPGTWQYSSLASGPLNIKRDKNKNKKKRAATDSRRAFFSNRVVDHWKRYQSEATAAKSVNTFKNSLLRTL